MNKLKFFTLSLLVGLTLSACGQKQEEAVKAHNPVVWADIPDMSMIRVGDTYYMSSTTMHMNPGVPIMKSKNLVDWEIASYAYETLADIDAYELEDGRSAYGNGTWASSMRYHNGTFYVSTFANDTGQNYIFHTKDPNKTPWEKISFQPMIHDHSFFFDDDQKVYMITCVGQIGIKELKSDLTGLKEGGAEAVLIENADDIVEGEVGLRAEGAQMFKANDKYYLFLITWPRGGMRTVLVYRADNIMGPYEGRVALQDRGIAQGGIVDTPDGEWYGYFFRDSGGVGRIPYMVPMVWEDGWPVFGTDGKVPDELDIVAKQPSIPQVVASDDFSRKTGDRELPLVWQWNHNPNNDYWSLKEREGYLRLTTFRLNNNFLDAKNTLTQRTFGPECSCEVAIDVSYMKDGDFAGLGLLQRYYGLVGVKMEGGDKFIYAGDVKDDKFAELDKIVLDVDVVYLKVEADYRDRADKGYLFYSLDGEAWESVGEPFDLPYTLPHFMGYRFALYNYATQQTGGYVDFDYFKVGSEVTNK